MRLKGGDTEAFRHIYDRYKARLFLFSLKFLRSEEQAEEIVHDVFLKIWEERRGLDPDRSFGSYLHTVCKHHIFNLLKRIARQRRYESVVRDNFSGTANLTENVVLFREYSRLAEEAINTLPPRRRMVYRLCREEGKSYEEAAEELGISRNAVKDHLVKAGKTIRKFFSVRADIKFNTPLLVFLFFRWF